MTNRIVSAGWEPVAAAFDRNQERGLDDGASLTVLRDGATVVDIWGGVDPITGRDWEPDSTTVGFSVTKGAATICLLQLIDRGVVALDEPVASYWPEFAANGKDRVTVRHVLTHLSALPVIALDDITQIVDWELVTSTLAAQPLQYELGTTFVYHALSFGFLVGEIVHRASGMPFARFYEENVRAPLGLDFWIGQPESQDEQFRPGLLGEPGQFPQPDLGAMTPECAAAFLSSAQVAPLTARRGAPGTEPFNSETVRRAVIPAANGVTNGRSLARMYAACAQPVDGVRLLSDELMAEASRNQLLGARFPECGFPTVESTVGLGFEISHSGNPMLGRGSFGHSGMGGRLGFVHPESGIAFGFVSQRMLQAPPGEFDPRWAPLLDAVLLAAKV
jgi:CubicO group peptidase (beta-lactamase class C family)